MAQGTSGSAMTMSSIRPATRAAKAARSNLDDGLCNPFQSGTIIVNARDEFALVTESAARILGRKNSRGKPQKLDALPAPLQLAVAEARADRRWMSQRKATLTLPGGHTPTLRMTVFPLEAGKRK